MTPAAAAEVRNARRLGERPGFCIEFLPAVMMTFTFILSF
jgi:hypothetical protein